MIKATVSVSVTCSKCNKTTEYLFCGTYPFDSIHQVICNELFNRGWEIIKNGSEYINFCEDCGWE